MAIAYSLLYLEKVINDDIKKLPNNIKHSIKKAIETRILIDPLRAGKPLRYSLKGTRPVRVGDYRILYVIDYDLKTITITAIKHRGNVYLVHV